MKLSQQNQEVGLCIGFKMASLSPIEFNNKSAFRIEQDGLFGLKENDMITYDEIPINDKKILEAIQLNYLIPTGTSKQLKEERMIKKYGGLSWEFMKFAGRLPTLNELKQYIWLVIEPVRHTEEEMVEWERRLNKLQQPILKEKYENLSYMYGL